jgi:hypothetical protein
VHPRAPPRSAQCAQCSVQVAPWHCACVLGSEQGASGAGYQLSTAIAGRPRPPSTHPASGTTRDPGDRITQFGFVVLVEASCCTSMAKEAGAVEVGCGRECRALGARRRHHTCTPTIHMPFTTAPLKIH